MAEINQEVAASESKPTAAAKKPAEDPSLACDDTADPGLDYMQARVAARGAAGSAAAVAAQVAAEGYESDEEVYATAKALEERQGNGRDYDENDNVVVSRKQPGLRRSGGGTLLRATKQAVVFMFGVMIQCAAAASVHACEGLIRVHWLRQQCLWLHWLRQWVQEATW